jgi:hypothetical protein
MIESDSISEAKDERCLIGDIAAMRRRVNTIAAAQPITLDEALQLAQQRRIVLIAMARSVKLWSPGQRIPSALRLVIKANNKEVLKMLDIGDIAVCPAPYLHRPAWSYFAGHYICDICARIDRQMRGLN